MISEDGRYVAFASNAENLVADSATNGEEHYAFYVDSIEKPGFYDAYGKPVQKTFLKCPVRYTGLDLPGRNLPLDVAVPTKNAQKTT